MITRSVLAGGLCAVHLYASSAIGATSPGESVTSLLHVPFPNSYTETDISEDPAPYCPVKTIGYHYDEAFLNDINVTLGQMKEWLVTWKLFDASLVEIYFEQNNIPEADWDMKLSDDFREIFAIDNIYKAGSPEGLIFLREDPINVQVATDAYLKNRDALRFMLSETFLMDMNSQFGDKLDQYRYSVASMNEKLEALSQGPCHTPSGP